MGSAHSPDTYGLSSLHSQSLWGSGYERYVLLFHACNPMLGLLPITHEAACVFKDLTPVHESLSPIENEIELKPLARHFIHRINFEHIGALIQLVKEMRVYL